MRLAQLPTPLQRAPRLSEALGVEVLVKRDDLTGLGLGGNKVRILEPLLGEALAAVPTSCSRPAARSPTTPR